MRDAISRQAVLEGLASIAKAKAKSDAQKSLIGRVMFFTEQLPSISTEKTGRWLNDELIPNDISGHIHAECSICHKVRIVDNYCPNCGAFMGVEE